MESSEAKRQYAPYGNGIYELVFRFHEPDIIKAVESARLSRDGMTLLDLGCATGFLIEELTKRTNKRTTQIVGVDCTPELLAQAKKKLDIPGVTLLEEDITKAGFLHTLKKQYPEGFDRIFCIWTLDQLQNPSELLRLWAKSLLKPQGLIIISINHPRQDVGTWEVWNEGTQARVLEGHKLPYRIRVADAQTWEEVVVAVKEVVAEAGLSCLESIPFYDNSQWHSYKDKADEMQHKAQLEKNKFEAGVVVHSEVVEFTTTWTQAEKQRLISLPSFRSPEHGQDRLMCNHKTAGVLAILQHSAMCDRKIISGN